MPISQLKSKSWQKLKQAKVLAKSQLIHKMSRPKRDRKKMIKKIIAYVVIVGVVGLLLGAIFLIGAFAWFSRDLPDPNKVIDRVIAESTKIYDRKGETLLWEIHGDEKRTTINLDQVNDYIIKATIAAEDKHFYEHHGINIFSIIQGVILDPLRGRGTRGGSTLTQQLVKNAILTNERSIERKIKEWILSYQIERKFSKDQILKMYFNEVPYGSVNYGVESAANYFFGKHAKDVTLAEAAILAALPQAPTRLSPYGSHTDQLFSRQHWVLDEMVQVKYITKEQAEEAKNQKIEFKKEELSGIIAPHFVFYVKELLAEKFGEKILEQGGLKVTTTLDLDKQKFAEDAMKNAREKNKEYKATNAALVSLDAKTGEILAMVGSMDFNDKEIDGQVNVVVMPRQPGSSIKPVVYATAFEKGYTSETVLYDVNTVFPTETGPYDPKDYDKKERGPLTIRKALAGSLNIPAVKTLYLAGIENVKNKMKDLGYSTITDKSQCGLSLVLGGCEVKLLDHVDAFTAFARDGERAESAALLKVVDKDNNVLDEFKEVKHKIFSENTARQINSIMTDDSARAYIFGAGSPLTLPGRPVAAKTGTTNSNKDAWTIGFTPSYVTGVWVGNNRGEEMSSRADGVNVAAPIWNEYMRNILKDSPVETFKAPAPLDEKLSPALRGVIESEKEIDIDKASGKLATPLTPASFIEKKKFRQDHDILFYVNKDNPQGPAPENPAGDPMFKPWEDGIEAWLKKQAEEKKETFVREQPPTEFDDLHVPANTPTITLAKPENNQTIESYPVRFEANASALRGLNRIVYEVDGKVAGTARSFPYYLEVNALDVTNGYHKVRATAYDDIDNSNSVEIDVNLKLPTVAAQINWINPRQNGTFYLSNWPLNVSFSLSKLSNLKKATFYYAYNGSSQKIAEIVEFPSNDLSFRWLSAPGPGNYEVYAEFEEIDGTTSQSNKLNLTILQ